MLMCKYRHDLLGLNTLSFHCPGYQQEEKGNTDRRIYFSLMDSTASHKTPLCYYHLKDSQTLVKKLIKMILRVNEAANGTSMRKM